MDAIILLQPSRRSPCSKGVPSHLDSESTFNKFQYEPRFTFVCIQEMRDLLSIPLVFSLSFSLFPPTVLHPSFSLPPRRAGRSLAWRVSRLIRRSSANAWPCHRKRAVRSNFRFSPGGIATGKREIPRVIPAMATGDPPFLVCNVCVYIPPRITSPFYFFVTFN